jgi:hypothetical protein
MYLEIKADTTVHTANRRRMLEVLKRKPHKFKALLVFFIGNVMRNRVVVCCRVAFNRRKGGEFLCGGSNLMSLVSTELVTRRQCIYTQQIFNYSEPRLRRRLWQNTVQKRSSMQATRERS